MRTLASIYPSYLGHFWDVALNFYASKALQLRGHEKSPIEVCP